ncbi:hypothetical protein V8G54_030620 [Vigna mungo]|uniref:Uncharacterized protein n=1 Tax=Vigna mungo TaxID=3915 RepID=A0AAQ3MVG2_VIGMU
MSSPDSSVVRDSIDIDVDENGVREKESELDGVKNRKARSGEDTLRNRYGLDGSESESSDSDCSDCELMDREQWENISVKRKRTGFNDQPFSNEHASSSGLHFNNNVCTDIDEENRNRENVGDTTHFCPTNGENVEKNQSSLTSDWETFKSSLFEFTEREMQLLHQSWEIEHERSTRSKDLSFGTQNESNDFCNDVTGVSSHSGRNWKVVRKIMSSATSIGLSANSWLRCHVSMPPSCFPVSVSYSSSSSNFSKFCHYIRRASSEGKIYNLITVFSNTHLGHCAGALRTTNLYIMFSHSAGLPNEVVEDSKFVPLNAEDPIYGPPALLLLGFEAEEALKYNVHVDIEQIQQLLKELDGEFLKVIYCTEDMITSSLWEAMHTTQQSLEEVKIAKSLPRICFFSGLSGEEMMMFIDSFPETGLKPAAFAALVPNSANKPLQELIEEVKGDHEMLALVGVVVVLLCCDQSESELVMLSVMVWVLVEDGAVNGRQLNPAMLCNVNVQ